MWSVLNYTFLPFGNAYYPQTAPDTGCGGWHNKCCDADNQPPECFEGTISCQHGESECEADRWEACATVGFPGIITAKQSAEFAYCLESNNINQYAKFAEICANTVGIDYEMLSECAMDGSAAGDQATVIVAQYTAEYQLMYPLPDGSPNSWVGTPTVILNGATLRTTGNLLKQVCNAAGADAPPGCF
jgi:hypothetical protein